MPLVRISLGADKNPGLALESRLLASSADAPLAEDRLVIDNHFCGGNGNRADGTSEAKRVPFLALHFHELNQLCVELSSASGAEGLFFLRLGQEWASFLHARPTNQLSLELGVTVLQVSFAAVANQAFRMPFLVQSLHTLFAHRLRATRTNLWIAADAIELAIAGRDEVILEGRLAGMTSEALSMPTTRPDLQEGGRDRFATSSTLDTEQILLAAHAVGFTLPCCKSREEYSATVCADEALRVPVLI